jgi:hypothetical protein
MSADFEREISQGKINFLSEFFSFAKSSGNGIPKKKSIFMRSFEILSGISKKKSQREKKENAKETFFAKAKREECFQITFLIYFYIFFFLATFVIRFIYTVTVVIIYFAGDSQGKPIRKQKLFS